MVFRARVAIVNDCWDDRGVEAEKLGQIYCGQKRREIDMSAEIVETLNGR